MINDSDEEVLYGSDTEELLSISGPDDFKTKQQHEQYQPNSLNAIPNLIDTRTDEESD